MSSSRRPVSASAGHRTLRHRLPPGQLYMATDDADGSGFGNFVGQQQAPQAAALRRYSVPAGAAGAAGPTRNDATARSSAADGSSGQVESPRPSRPSGAIKPSRPASAVARRPHSAVLRLRPSAIQVPARPASALPANLQNDKPPLPGAQRRRPHTSTGIPERGTLVTPAPFIKEEEILTQIGVGRTTIPMQDIGRVVTEAAIREVGVIARGDPIGEQAMEIRPMHAAESRNASVHAKGFRLRAQGDVVGAIHEYGRALRVDPHDFKSLFNRAFLYIKAAKYHAALQDLQVACTVEPANPFAHYNMGICYMALKDYDSAISAFDEAVTYEQENVQFRKARAQAYRAAGRFSDAIIDYVHARQLEDLEAVDGFEDGVTAGSGAKIIPRASPRSLPVAAPSRSEEAAHKAASVPEMGNAAMPNVTSPRYAWTVEQVKLDKLARRIQAEREGDFSGANMYYSHGPVFYPEHFKPTPNVITAADARRQCRDILHLAPNARSMEHLSLLVDLTKRVRAFARLSDENLLEMCRHLRYQEIPPNTLVYKQGEAGDTYFIILTGSIAVFLDHTGQAERSTLESLAMSPRGTARVTMTGQKITPEEVFSGMLAKLQEHDQDHDHGGISAVDTGSYHAELGLRLGMLQNGDAFGERALQLDDGYRRELSMLTLEPTSCMTITRESFQAVIAASNSTTVAETARFLASVPLLSGLTHVEYIQLASGAQRQRFHSGTTIVKEGSIVTGISVVRKGRCTIWKSPHKHPSPTRRRVSQVETVGATAYLFQRAADHEFLQLKEPQVIPDTDAMQGLELGALGPRDTYGEDITLVVEDRAQWTDPGVFSPRSTRPNWARHLAEGTLIADTFVEMCFIPKELLYTCCNYVSREKLRSNYATAKPSSSIRPPQEKAEWEAFKAQVVKDLVSTARHPKPQSPRPRASAAGKSTVSPRPTTTSGSPRLLSTSPRPNLGSSSFNVTRS